MYEIYCKLRDSLGLKDADVAKAAGITKSTFTDWKNGRSSPKKEKLMKIADVFGVSVDYLMTGENESEKSGYYLDPEAAVTAQEIFENDHVLFDVYRSCDKDRLVEYAKKLKSLREMEEMEGE